MDEISLPHLYADNLFTAELLVKTFEFECLGVQQGPPKLWVLQPTLPFCGTEEFIKILRAQYLRCKIEGRDFPGSVLQIDIPSEDIHVEVYIGDPPC